MSLRPAEIAPVPATTAQVAVAAFPRGCAAMRMRDELGAIYDDQTFASLSPGARSDGVLTLAPGPSDGPAVRRGSAGPAGSRCGPWSDRLEGCAQSGTDGSRVRLLRAVRVPRPLDR